jgi:hypothetical protein
MTDLSEREMVQEWMENKRYSREDLLEVVRNNKWIHRKKYTVPETSKIPLTRKHKRTLLSPIQRNLTALLNTNTLMTGAQIEEFLSHLVNLNRNMSFMVTDFGPILQHEGQLYWDYIMGTEHLNYAQKAKGMKDTVKHILYIPLFTGETTRGHWSLIVRHINTHGKVALYHMDSLSRFDDHAPYTLSNTALYSQNRDSWQNARTVRQTEHEYGMILCLAATMIAQYRGTIPK